VSFGTNCDTTDEYLTVLKTPARSPRANAHGERVIGTIRRECLDWLLPLTLLTVANLFAAWRASGAIRGWWLAAGVTALADRVGTFSYFIPTMVGLMRATDSPEAVGIATRWGNLNYLRHAFVLAAWLAALRTFALFYQQHE
jgi:hypothetical protein